MENTTTKDRKVNRLLFLLAREKPGTEVKICLACGCIPLEMAEVIVSDARIKAVVSAAKLEQNGRYCTFQIKKLPDFPPTTATETPQSRAAAIFAQVPDRTPYHLPGPAAAALFAPSSQNPAKMARKPGVWGAMWGWIDKFCWGKAK